MMKISFVIIIFTIFNFNISPTQNLTPKEKYGEALDAIFGIGIRLQTLLDTSETNKNFLVSPVSAALLIGQLMLGAEREFLDELYNLLSLPSSRKKSVELQLQDSLILKDLPYSKLHYQLGSLLRKLEENPSVKRSFKLDTASALFYDSNFKLKREFERYLYIYKSETTPLNFYKEPKKAMQTLNKWGFNHTNGLIPEFITEPLPSTTKSIFVNSIYFKADWETPFNDIFNRKGPFSIKKDQTVNVTYMYRFIEDIYYAQSKKYKCKMLSLPYKEEDVSMYIILPDLDNKNAFNIKYFVEDLQLEGIQELEKNLQKTDVDVKIPKMSLSNTVSILQPLRKYSGYMKYMQAKGRTLSSDLEERIKDYINFNQNETLKDIKLTNAEEDQDLIVSDIVQQMTLAVHEKGTEAAAITAGIIDYMGVSKMFIINRPFMFFIKHEETKAVLFWGTISDPSLC